MSSAALGQLLNRHYDIFISKCVDFVFYCPRFKVANFNQWPCKVGLSHATRHLDSQGQLVDLPYAAIPHKDYCVQDMRNHAKLDSAHEALDCVKRAAGVYYAYHTDAGKPHVCKNFEVVRPSYFIKNRVVWSY